jgi:Tyrosine phosphatase family
MLGAATDRWERWPSPPFAILRLVTMCRRLAVLVSVAVSMAVICPPPAKTQPAVFLLCPSEAKQQTKGDQEPSRQSTETRIAKKLIPHFAEVTPTLYRGAQPTEAGFEELAKMGVQIVVDLRGIREKERKELAPLGIQYVPMPWQCSFPKDQIFADFITLIRTNPGKKIFVHCRVGDDRTGMMIAAYRMVEEGWSAQRAKEEMVHFGFSYIHRHLICLRLADYEEEFPMRFATEPVFEKLRATSRIQNSK